MTTSPDSVPPSGQGRASDSIPPSLREESEKLARSWMRIDSAELRDYLIADVEDPRINAQSILSRHFLIRQVAGELYPDLMRAELLFSGVMNWLLELHKKMRGAIDADSLLYALDRRADNAEGVEIPEFVIQAFAALPAVHDGLEVPNYIRDFLTSEAPPNREHCSNTFQRLWSAVLMGLPGTPEKLRVLEPACGSANDYRFLYACGLTTRLEYTGIDLCQKNIENARALYPDARFETGNVFSLPYPDASFDCCFVHDLFEHLSLRGLETAAAELCRVTRQALCLGFFNMDELPRHEVRPVEEYHWNRLSMELTRELFLNHGFSGRVVHIGTLLRKTVGVENVHNPNAYTFLLSRPATA